ncbi:MAG: hypothetical protein ACPGVI_03985 [Crocinitomicaceae bacterium]
MKKLILKFGAFSLAISLSLFSCKKKEVEPATSAPTPTTTETFNSLADYFASNAVESELFTVTAENGGQYSASKGSSLTIPANAFITADGQAVTGAVTIKLKEVFSTNDIINSGIFPISNSYILNSGGEYYLEAKQNGNLLRVADGTFVELSIPAQAIDNNMELFFAAGGEDVDSVNWEVQPDTLANSNFSFNSADGTYDLVLDSLGWGNIDAFDWSVMYFDCDFNLTGLSGLDNSNTTAFAVFQGQNSVWPTGVPSWGTISNNVISETHLADVPLNLVVISVVNGQLYYGLLDITPQQGTTYSIPMIATTSANLDQVIENLP